MLETILSHTLTPRQVAFGLEISEPDDHLLLLVKEDKVLERWFVTNGHPTIIEIQEAADRVIEASEGIPFTVEDFAR